MPHPSSLIAEQSVRSGRPGPVPTTCSTSDGRATGRERRWNPASGSAFFRSFSVYLAGNGLRVGIPFLLLPVLTAVLTPAEYGVLALVQALVQFVLPLTPMNIDTALGIAYFRCPRTRFASYVSSALLAPMAMTAALMVLLAFAAKPIAGATGIPPGWVMVIPLFGLAQLLPNVVLKLFQMRRQPLAHAGFSLGLAALNITLSLAAVLLLGLGWAGRMYGIFLSYIVFSIVAWLLLGRFGYLTRGLRREHFLDAARFSLPLVPHSLAGALMALADRFLLSAMAGVEAVGAYAVGFQVGSAMLIVGTSVNQAWAPRLFEKLGTMDPAERARLVRQSCLVAGLLAAGFAVLLALMPLIFSRFVSEGFSSSQQYAGWIALAGLFNGFYMLVGNYIFYEKKTYILSGLTAGSALLNVGLNCLWIPKWGGLGAAYASAASSFAFFVLSWLLAQRVHPMPWLDALRPGRFAAANG